MSTYIWECLISRMLIHQETFKIFSRSFFVCVFFLSPLSLMDCFCLNCTCFSSWHHPQPRSALPLMKGGWLGGQPHSPAPWFATGFVTRWDTAQSSQPHICQKPTAQQGRRWQNQPGFKSCKRRVPSWGTGSVTAPSVLTVVWTFLWASVETELVLKLSFSLPRMASLPCHIASRVLLGTAKQFHIPAQRLVRALMQTFCNALKESEKKKVILTCFCFPRNTIKW